MQIVPSGGGWTSIPSGDNWEFSHLIGSVLTSRVTR